MGKWVGVGQQKQNFPEKHDFHIEQNVFFFFFTKIVDTIFLCDSYCFHS